MQWQGLVLNVITYTALISACEKGQQPEQATRLYEAMQWQGLVPNVITYTALISACEGGQQWQCALNLLGETQDARCGGKRHRLLHRRQCFSFLRCTSSGGGGMDAALCDIGTSRFFNYYVNGLDWSIRREPHIGKIVILSRFACCPSC